MVNNKFILLSALFVVSTAMSSCADASKKKAEQQTAVEVSSECTAAKKYLGTYEGTLPCADCDGNKTTLSILEDGTYELKNEYLGKEYNSYTECGTYYLKDGVIELVTPSSGRKTYYKVLEESVALCDSVGTLNDGELADKYILKKK